MTWSNYQQYTVRKELRVAFCLSRLHESVPDHDHGIVPNVQFPCIGLVRQSWRRTCGVITAANAGRVIFDKHRGKAIVQGIKVSGCAGIKPALDRE